MKQPNKIIAAQVALDCHDRLQGLAHAAGSSKIENQARSAWNVYAYLAGVAPYGNGPERITKEEALKSAERAWGDQPPDEIVKALEL